MMFTPDDWTVEVGNNISDTNFGEDQIKSFSSKIQRAIASILTLVINQLKEHNPDQNLKIIRENMTYDKNNVYSIFAKI